MGQLWQSAEVFIETIVLWFYPRKKEKTALLKLAIVRSLWAILASFHVFLPCVQTYHTGVTCYFTVKNYQIYVKRTLHEWNCHGDHTWSLPTLALYLFNIRWLLTCRVSDKSIWSSVVKKAQIVASHSCQSIKSCLNISRTLVLDCNQDYLTEVEKEMVKCSKLS